jgi:glycerol-3-phosphate dehydrogenase
MQEVVLDQVRARTRDQLADAPLDVLVIGGGIVGAGIVRDAAMRGLRAGLVEQHDLAYGSSSRSSRLLHGGIRYLAQGRIGLVYEASQEKRVLCRIAPHLAGPLPFVFPTYRGSGWPFWPLRIGVKVYDLLCWGKNLGPSCSMGPAEVMAQLPGIERQGLSGAVRYYDALTNDARLVLDTIRSAAGAGAIVANYVRVEEVARDGSLWRCRATDVLRGDSYEIQTRTVVNATGPWGQKLAPSGVRLRLTKGVHLVVQRDRLGIVPAVVMAEGTRIAFAIPWGRRLILGTTDTDYQGEIEDVRTEPEDVKYILDLVNHYFPAAALTEGDVRASWAGLRPLIYTGRGGPSDISRAHQILMPQPGWLDVAGGKLTTYRLIAQQAVDRLLKHLGRKGLRCRTALRPLLEVKAVAGISSLVPPLPSPELVAQYCADQWAVHLDDVMIRRTSWHYYLDDAGQVADRVAEWMGAVFGWDAQRREAELTRYRNVPT